VGSMTEVGDHITEQVDGALAGLGAGPFVSQASCVDVLLDLYAATDGTAMQPVIAAGLARISKVNLVEADEFRVLLLEIAALAAVAGAVDLDADGAMSAELDLAAASVAGEGASTAEADEPTHPVFDSA
jgi:hypothetical protein